MRKILGARESDIYEAISNYMMIKYPDVVYRFDFAAGMKMSMYQAKQHKYMNPWSGYPDLFICYPNGKFCGLFIEIKKKGISPFKKDGTLKSDEHLQRQNDMLISLHRCGYRATFGSGLEQCIEIIDTYMSGQ
jgi:hypothetical protein